jgi:hypothetical protein
VFFIPVWSIAPKRPNVLSVKKLSTNEMNKKIKSNLQQIDASMSRPMSAASETPYSSDFRERSGVLMEFEFFGIFPNNPFDALPWPVSKLKKGHSEARRHQLWRWKIFRTKTHGVRQRALSRHKRAVIRYLTVDYLQIHSNI